MSGYAPFVAALVCLLLGLTVGKAWERYKLKAGRLIDRRRAPESLHYILGLNFLVTNQLDLVGFIVRDFHACDFLNQHYQFEAIEPVGSQIAAEMSMIGDMLDIDV